MSMTKILPCNCKHEFQDKLYGKGMRVHNQMTKENKLGDWRCTSCGKPKEGHTKSEKE